MKSVGKNFGPVKLPSTFNKPIFEKLRTEHLNEMFTGLITRRQSVPESIKNEETIQIEEAIKTQEMMETEETIESEETIKIDESIKTENVLGNASVADEAKHQPKSEASSTRRFCGPINKPLINKLQLCLQSMREMKAENESQRAELIKLREENTRLKDELAQNKRSIH